MIIAFFKKRNVNVIFKMTIGTIIYCIGVVWVLDLGGFYAGGVTGVSQLIASVLNKFGIVVSISFFIPLINLPLFIIGWKGVSKRFALLSLGSVIIQVVVIALLEFFRSKGLEPFYAIKQDNDTLMLAILGGLITGVGSGISLRAGASTGGMDIINQYVSFKKDIPFAKLSMLVDLTIIILAGLIGTLEIAIYTTIRLIITILVLDRIHTIYKYLKVEIVTTEKEAMREALIAKFNHGITIYEVIGGYTNRTKWVLTSVVSSYEAEEYRNLAKQIDSKSFITYTSVKQIHGLFNRNIIT